MNKLVLICSIVLLCLNTLEAKRAVPNYLTPNDLTRLQKVFVDSLASKDLQAIYYASLNVEATNAKEKEALCKNLNELHAESKLNDFEKDFYLIGGNKNLHCTQTISETLLSNVRAAFKNDIPSSSQEIYYRAATLKVLGMQIDSVASGKIVKKLQELLKKYDTIVNLGYAFNIATELGPTAAFVTERLEDVIVQADEVDDVMLQFEGGLSITALVINGAFNVAKTFKKPLPVNAEQAEKLANYFLSRRSVQTAKGAHLLIEALKTISSAKEVTPICVQVIGNGQLKPESPLLSVAVVELLGKAVSPAPQMIFGKVMLKKDNSVLAEKVQFVSKSSDKTIFAADLSSYKPTRGIYTVNVNIDNIYEKQLQFKLLGRVKVNSLEIGVAESDSSASLKKQNVAYPNRLPEKLEADSTQKLLIKVGLVDEITTKPISVHQAFVRLRNTETDQEIIFVAEQDSSGVYKFDMDVGPRANDFGYKSGLYEISLIVGDASLSNSFQWHLANVQLKFPQRAISDKKQQVRQALPEIVHQFRVPEKRPPRLVSDIFTGLCLTPLVLLFIFWSKLGINVSNFKFSANAIGFHGGFAGIMALFTLFWLKLTMFETLRWLIPVAALTFICGISLLRSIYAKRIAKSGTTASS